MDIQHIGILVAGTGMMKYMSTNTKNLRESVKSADYPLRLYPQIAQIFADIKSINGAQITPKYWNINKRNKNHTNLHEKYT